ncbi:MAG TPA: short-chain dehydrogenase/reductase [Solirubrobacterales bacterium]|nr:short-chain dehydrogenase/reductase [Solirubrobacterales bacterium]
MRELLDRRKKVLELRGKSALVTGAARGIGFATARALVARGASVAIVDLDPEAAKAAAAQIAPPPGGAGGPVAIGIGADVADAEAIEAAATEAAGALGGIDICVANAGIAPLGATVRALDPAAFERVIDVNLLGVWRTVRAVLPYVTESRDGGHLVLISSVYSFTNGACVSPYACSKAAVEQLGRSLMVELAGDGTGVSVAYFGFVDTEMVRQGFEKDELGRRMQSMVPSRLRESITPTHAGESIVRGIETRRPQIIEPRKWVPLSLFRGITGPLSDRTMVNHPRLQEMIREADVPNSRPGPALTDTASRPAKK